MKIIENTRQLCPLVHCITNYVTVNDVANTVLACGGSPIMADDVKEVEEMQSICSALVINIGTLNERTIESMFLAGKKANETNHVVVLDPVGVGATKLRTDTALKLLQEVKFDVIRGNISEIKVLALGSGKTSGVDACDVDRITEDNLDEVIKLAKEFSIRTNAIVAITGPIDVITDGNKTFITRNGNPNMGKITGTGCMLTGIIASYVAANIDNKLEATAYAVAAMAYSGENSFNNLKKDQGTGTLRVGIIDKINLLDDKILKEGSKIEVR